MPTALDTPSTYPTYTNRAIEEGVFEQLMAAVKHHVGEEYKAGRIQADQYGQVYLGLTEACLENSTQFILGLLLLDEKRRAADLANQKAEFELEQILPAQLRKLEAEISLMGKQEDKIDKEIEFLTWKIETEKANTQADVAAPTSLIGKQISLLTAQRLGFAGDLQSKIAKMYADYDSIYQSVQELEAMTTLQVAWTDTHITAASDIVAEIEALT